MSPETSAPALSPDEERDLSSVLDEIIPPRDDGRLPGAGALGLAGHIQRTMREKPDFRFAVVEGLAALRALAGRGGFAARSGEERRELLGALAEQQPAFLPGLVFQTYMAYYQDDRVVAALGLEARPPFPDGYELEPFDATLLDAVRRRPRLYREC